MTHPPAHVGWFPEEPGEARVLRVGVFADELMATAAVGALFARRGWATRVFTVAAELDGLPDRLRNRCTDVVVINTDARFCPPEEGAERVRRATNALFRWGADIYYNETCSAGPGVVGDHFDTMLAELAHDFGLTVVALPRHGQITLNGLHYVDGQLRDVGEHSGHGGLAEGATGLLPLSTVRAGTAAVRALLDAARAMHLRYLIADAHTPGDLVALAHTLLLEPVLLGSSGLVGELATHCPSPAASAGFDPFEGLRPGTAGGVLVIAGAVAPEAARQVEALAATGVPVLTLSAEQALDGRIGPLMSEVAIRLGEGQPVVVRPDTSAEGVAATEALAAAQGHGPEAARRIVRETLAAFTEAASCRLIVMGGDTCAAVCSHLGTSELVVLDEVVPGLPATYTTEPRPMLMVLKSGTSGGADFLSRAIAHLRRIT
ncbi:hypothetical protein D3C72_392320 [compost metagenome]